MQQAGILSTLLTMGLFIMTYRLKVYFGLKLTIICSNNYAMQYSSKAHVDMFIEEDGTGKDSAKQMTSRLVPIHRFSLNWFDWHT